MLNQTKMKKTKRKSPNPTLGGMADHFGKTFQRQKVRKQAQVILVLKSLKHLLSLQSILFFVTNSQSLYYVPDQALSNQRQAI